MKKKLVLPVNVLIDEVVHYGDMQRYVDRRALALKETTLFLVSKGVPYKVQAIGAYPRLLFLADPEYRGDTPAATVATLFGLQGVLDPEVEAMGWLANGPKMTWVVAVQATEYGAPGDKDYCPEALYLHLDLDAFAQEASDDA
jgi:hypothetical protein